MEGDGSAAVTQRAPIGWRRALLGDWTPLLRDPLDLLRLTFAAGAIVLLVEGNESEAVRLGFTFVLVLVARALELPRLFDLAFLLGMSFQAWGNVFSLFETLGWYDKMVHFVLPLATAPLLYILLIRLKAVPDLTDEAQAHHMVGIFLITFALGFAIGTFYEIYEWAMVKAFSADFVVGYEDTITDLLDDATGSALGGALLVIWSVYGWKTSRRMPAPRAARRI